MAPIVPRVLNSIDLLNTRVGKLASFLILPLIATVSYEVFARYLFGAPTIWSFKLTTFLWGGTFLLGGGWVLKEGRHVSVDIASGRLSERGRAILNTVCYCVLFLPFIGILLWKGIDSAIWSWEMMETEYETLWQAPLYPIKTVIPIAFALLLAQGIAETVRSLLVALKRRVP